MGRSAAGRVWRAPTIRAKQYRIARHLYCWRALSVPRASLSLSWDVFSPSVSWLSSVVWQLGVAASVSHSKRESPVAIGRKAFLPEEVER